MSLMFPTIFALGLKGLGDNTKIAGSLLVMAIIGGAVLTPLTGLIKVSRRRIWFPSSLTFSSLITDFSVHMYAGLPPKHRTMTRRYCYSLDLKDDPVLIAEYKKHHEKIWPEVAESYRQCGVESMEIYLLGTRMFMIMEVNEHFSFEKKANSDRTNPKVQQWEQLMGKFQQVPSHAQNGNKWMPMERIFRLESFTPVK